MNRQLNKENLPVNDLWRFLPDPHGDGEKLGFWKADFDTRLWREVMVPSCFEVGGPNFDCYEGIGWYQRTFRLPAAWRSRRVVLRFEAVNYRAKVWLNGKLLGQHADGFLPFEFEVGDQARWDNDNVLAVSVDNTPCDEDVPGRHVGWRGYGGILREVSLSATDLLHIADLNVVATPNANGGHVECRINLRNNRSVPANAVLDVVIHNASGKAVATLDQRAVRVAPGESAGIVISGILADVGTWSPTTPVLYQAVVRLTEQNKIVDTVDTKLGFRRVEATSAGLLLNGQPIFLTGFNRHEDSPRNAMATDLETTRRDLEQIKEAGANFVRLCHYPHHPAELDMCDELGLLVMCEIPLYKGDTPPPTNAVRVAVAGRQLKSLIARDANHPSVIFWSVSNETSDQKPEVAESNRALIRLARALALMDGRDFVTADDIKSLVLPVLHHRITLD
ncbi:MAG: glycoside hydrolase family 2 TIM barrel-domain containing protein, partial [Verrucomicrobiota bacterium]